MAARLRPSQLPPPAARQLGPGSPRVGLGAVAHEVLSDTSGLAGAAREGVMDKSDLPRRGEEGSEGQRGPGRTAAAQAPLHSAPMGSMRLEGISVEEAMVTRTQLLEEELSSVKEELALCQVSRWPPVFPLHSRAGAGGEMRPSPSAFGCLAARVWDPPTSARRRPVPAPTPSLARSSGLREAASSGSPPSGSRPSPDSGRAGSAKAPWVWLTSLGSHQNAQSHPYRPQAQGLCRDCSGTWCSRSAIPELKCGMGKWKHSY